MEKLEDIWYLYAYPPSDRLKNALVDGSIDRVFTTPVLRYEQLLKDEMSEVLTHFNKISSHDQEVTEDKDGLKHLIRRGKLKSAFNLTTKILVKMGHVPNAPIRRTTCSFESLEIWSCRFQLSVVLELHSILKEEIAAFNELDAPDLYFEFRSFYRRLNFKGSVVPFQMRLLHAEIPRFSDEYELSLSRLAKLESNSKSVFDSLKEDEHRCVWRKRLEAIKLAQARIFYYLKDHIKSLGIYGKLLENMDDGQQKKIITSQILRITMSLGHSKFLESFISNSKSDERCYVYNKAMWAIFGANYLKALDCFNQDEQKIDSAEVSNNKAICYLYTGKVKEAVESLLAQKSTSLPLMKNLYTVGDLAFTNSSDLRSQHFAKHCESLSDLYDPSQLRIM